MAKRSAVETGIEPARIEPVLKPDSDDAGKHETGTEKPDGETKPVNGIGTIDPFDLPTRSDGAVAEFPGSEPRRRGRKPGGKNRPKAEVSQDINVNLEELIFGIHQGVAAICASEELELDHEESEKLATNFKRVASLYNKQFNPATLIWLAFVACLVEVYATRAVAIYKRLTVEQPRPVIVQSPLQTRSSDAAEDNLAAERTSAPITPAQIWPAEPIED